MFAIALKETYFTPVVVEVPDGSGKHTKHSFNAKFKRLKHSELDELHRRLNKDQLRLGEEMLTDDELLSDVLVGWEDVMDAEGNDLEFNAENMATLLNIFPVRSTLANAYFNSIKTGKTKN